MRGWASFDETGTYRSTLHRRWAPGGTRVAFCLLNPSTADARVLDPTLTRCLGFAQRWGHSAMEVVNIFTLRSTDPKGLKGCQDPVGPGADRAILRAAARADEFVVGWGTHGVILGRGEAVARMLEPRIEMRCWGRTASGAPKHPLYLASDTETSPYSAKNLAGV